MSAHLRASAIMNIHAVGSVLQASTIKLGQHLRARIAADLHGLPLDVG